MSKLYNKFCNCADNIYIDWDKTILSRDEKINAETYMVWGIVKAALYVLTFDEYNQFKKYLYAKHGFDAGGVGQLSLEELQNLINS